MQFVLVLEHNHKEEEVFLHYCQWNGNEIELTKLFIYIERANYENMGGDYSSFQYSQKILTEDAIDQHVAIQGFNSYSSMFQKHTGKFVCPDFDGYENGEDIARKLDRLFYACRLADYFHTH